MTSASAALRRLAVRDRYAAWHGHALRVGTSAPPGLPPLAPPTPPPASPMSRLRAALGTIHPSTLTSAKLTTALTDQGLSFRFVERSRGAVDFVALDEGDAVVASGTGADRFAAVAALAKTIGAAGWGRLVGGGDDD